MGFSGFTLIMYLNRGTKEIVRIIGVSVLPKFRLTEV